MAPIEFQYTPDSDPAERSSVWTPHIVEGEDENRTIRSSVWRPELDYLYSISFTFTEFSYQILSVPNTIITSLLFPYAYTEALSIPLPQFLTPGWIWGFSDEALSISYPEFSAGSLTVTIAYQSYTIDPIDELDIPLPTFSVGSLTVTIAYLTYTMDDNDSLDIPFPVFTGGVIETVIQYITYSNWALTGGEDMNIGFPTFSEGTLV